MEAVKSKIGRVSQQVGDQERGNVAVPVSQLAVCWQNFLLFRGGQFIILSRPSPDWMRPTHTMEDNLLKVHHFKS